MSESSPSGPSSKQSKQPAKTASSPKGGNSRKPRRAADKDTVVSPAAAGPSGAVLEAHVGAQYLLPLLSGGEARGLPGVVVTRVAFQRAALGHPMDDVIITGLDRQGNVATLELQAKRTLVFTAGDKTFADVVALACRSAIKPSFKTTRYELAVAVARTSTKIEQHIQEVLKWARNYQNSNDFFIRLNQSGAAHQAMRDFVSAFRGHMQTAGASHDDEDVLFLLSRFQVLAFDLEQAGSICELLARDRCALQLSPQDIHRAGDLWDSLKQIALEVDAAGGDLDSQSLRTRLGSALGYRLAGSRQLYVARERLSEIVENALDTIRTDVHGVAIDRTGSVMEALSALERGRYLEIRGAGGVGKSGVLKDLAMRIGVESRVVVVAPNRVPGGGWPAMATTLGCEVSAREFLIDLAGDGGGILFIDGIDRFEDSGQKATVVDLIRAAAQVSGVKVVVTARSDFDSDAREWLPAKAIGELGETGPLTVNELSNDEVEILRMADPALASLLRHGHPAEKLVRNPYRLDRLARAGTAESTTAFSEARMAWQWWITGDSADSANRTDRCRLLYSMAEHSLATSGPMDSRASSSKAIETLVGSGSLRIVSAVRVEPTHDVLRDWALGCLLHDEPDRLSDLSLNLPVPVRLVRGVEFAARLHAELESDDTAWRVLLERVSAPGCHGSWKRAVLLSLVRSEMSDEVLSRCSRTLAAGNAGALSDLVRAAITIDSQSAAPLFAKAGADVSKLTDDFVLPRGPAWLNLIVWSLAVVDRLPTAAVPQFIDLYSRWCSAFAGYDDLSPLLVHRLYEWLVLVEAKHHSRESHSSDASPKGTISLSMTTAQENDLRSSFLMWCKLCPQDAESYFRELSDHPYRHVVFRRLIPFIGTAAIAAPAALADLFLKLLTEKDKEDDDLHPLSERAFSGWDNEYFPASPARAPFLSLLLANREHGLRLIRGVVSHAIYRKTYGRDPGENHIEVPLLNGSRLFPWCQSYLWSRSDGTYVAASALMALEAWSHIRVERDESMDLVIEDILGPDGSPAAVILVAVDVMLSHWPKSRASLWPFAASASLLAMDRERFAHDILAGDKPVDSWVHPEPVGEARLEDLVRRPSRRTTVDSVLEDYGVHGPAEIREAMHHSLQAEVARFGLPNSDNANVTDARFAAMCALNRLDMANYQAGKADGSGQTLYEYIPPELEARLTAEIQTKAQISYDEATIRFEMMRAMLGTHSSQVLLERCVRWARYEFQPANESLDSDDQEWDERTRVIVAALVMRDGDQKLRDAHRDWAVRILIDVAKVEPAETAHVPQLQFNTSAIAAVGLLGVCRENLGSECLQWLLQLAAKRQTGMASVMLAESVAARSMDPQLTRSFIRLGLASSVYAVRHHDDDFDRIEDYREREQERTVARKRAERERLKSAVSAEHRWLRGEGTEPSWSVLPDPNPPKEKHSICVEKVPRKRVRSIQPSPEFALEAAEAAQWINLANELWHEDCPDMLAELVRHCWPWTASANGVGIDADEEPGELVYEWNDAFFSAALAVGVSDGGAGMEEFVYGYLASLPEERFFDAAEAQLHTLDRLWLDKGLVGDLTAVSIRESFCRRLIDTVSWHHVASSRSMGIAMHIAGVVASMFMGQQRLGKGPICYVPAAKVEQANLLLPLLTHLVEQAPGSTYVTQAFLGFLEVSPQVSKMAYLTTAVRAWWREQGVNSEFWIGHAIGRRICHWIDKAFLLPPASPDALESADLTAVVDILVQCGTPLARALEERLAAARTLGGR